ncbi:GMC family oxidoreductase [Conexibacter stalactiti]|uniref:GMC family oxidoreductase n=1 Tax=Conexibacter stalactiti TaxID=1940611 RepID=A0ABU4HWC6_9ACTN|nr:GMC family oxidoreductase [Conexibacter stalactiti]MDW5597631.1 GMC family oxidoreductase [Conexibacter stalactiti]MEC5038273.1 GMC family oxidoreductase [Conexibacter stalactiti]
MIRSADYIIAGGGTAGSILARRLSDAGAEVILVEAGPVGDADGRVTVLRRYVEMLGTELDFDYRTEPGSRGNDLMRYAQAKVLGGCSAHNSCIAFRAPDWDFEEWARGGLQGWSTEECAPYFERVFSMVNLEDPHPGHPWVDGFLAAAQSTGLPLVDFGAPNVREGVGTLKQNRRGELRESSAAAYLFPLAERSKGLRVVTDETVLRVVLDDRGEAIGIDTTLGRIFAREEVVLCGGTFGSAKTLLLSGIGPAGELSAAGVDPVVDLPGVGKHLVDHPDGLLLFEATEAVSNELTFTHWESALFACVEGGSEYPEVMIHFDTDGYSPYTSARGYPTSEAMLAMHPNVTRARSEGSVRLRSADPTAQLVIDTGYFSDPDGYDERIMLEGFRVAREVAAQPELARFIKRELAPGPDVVERAALSEYARTAGATVGHPAGTCKLGADDDPLAVVDSRLRVNGVGRLRVADASVLPAIVTVNPCMTVMMIGERCADELLAGAGR